MEGCTVLALGVWAIMERGRIDVVYLYERELSGFVDLFDTGICIGDPCLNLILESLVMVNSRTPSVL